MLLTLIASANEHIEDTHHALEHIAEHAPEAAHHTAHSMSTIEYLFHSNIFNWLLVVIFVLWLLKKFDVIGFFETKQKEIKDSIEKALQAKEEAQKELQDTQEKIKNVEAETTAIIEDSKETAVVMSDKVKDNATLKVKELNENTQKTIEAQTKSTVNSLSKEVTSAAFEIAQEHIKSAMNDDIQKEYIDEFIDNLENVKVK